LVQACRDVIGQPINHSGVSREHLLQQLGEVDALGLQEAPEWGCCEHHVTGHVELHVRCAGRDRVVD
jgi:hypothetical protein